MVQVRYTGDALWERIERAVEKVKDRLARVTAALEGAGIPYAVVGGNAVQVWVAQVDESAVRNTRDVDIKNVRTLPLEALVRMKLTSFRDKDRVHLRDMLDVGLIDVTWLDRFSSILRTRLEELINNPDG